MFSNLQQLITSMPDEKSCRAYLEQQIWNGKPVCPFCNHEKAYKLGDGKTYKCASRTCYKKFTITVGTVFQCSNIPLNKWFIAVYLGTANKKGISSLQLSKHIGVTQRTAWFMMHRIREMIKYKTFKMLSTMVEVDETYVGGKMKNKHKSIRNKAHVEGVSHTANKIGVMGLLERDSELKMQVIDSEKKTLKDMVRENVDVSAVVITDSLNAYNGLAKEFEAHEIVNHFEEEFVRGNIHTNSIEGAFSHFKRMVYGTYHQISPKHLNRYLDEFSYRFNSRKTKDSDRFTTSLQNSKGRLKYKDLVRKSVA